MEREEPIIEEEPIIDLDPNRTATYLDNGIPHCYMGHPECYDRHEANRLADETDWMDDLV